MGHDKVAAAAHDPMGHDGQWSLKTLAGYQSRTAEEIDWLWNASLPPNKDTHPAVWDSLIGFFEDAIVASCSRPGHLVITPRELLKQLKHNGREPASAMKVINELFRRGDVVRADTLQPPVSAQSPFSATSASSASAIGSIRSTLSSYIWGAAKPATPSLDDPLVSTASLKAAAARAQSLGGPTSSADIHTVHTFARAITADNAKDAQAVIAYMVSQKTASAIFTDTTRDQPVPVLGVRVGSTASQADKGVLQTKAALEQMEEMAKHLAGSVAVEQAAAIEFAKKGDKQGALNRLRKKKVLDAKLLSARSAASKLGDVLMAVDEAESNRGAVAALETGMASLKVATKDGVTADRIDAVAAEFDDALAEQQEVRLAFDQLNVDVAGVDVELEGELEDLMKEDEAQAKAGQVKDEQGKESKDVVDEAEEELARLLAELPMPDSAVKVGGSAAVKVGTADARSGKTQDEGQRGEAGGAGHAPLGGV